jgi:hypothetical protein
VGWSLDTRAGGSTLFPAPAGQLAPTTASSARAITVRVLQVARARYVCKSWPAALRGQRLCRPVLGGSASSHRAARHSWIAETRPAAAVVRVMGWPGATEGEKQEVLGSLQPEVSLVLPGGGGGQAAAYCVYDSCHS